MTKPLRQNDIKILTDIEHALKRPAMFIGSITEELVEQYVYVNDKIELQLIPTIPGIIKLFDEILINSLDEANTCKFKYANKIKIEYNKDTGAITVEDNGRGLPIEYNEETKKWTPEEIFTGVRSGSNFEDNNVEKGFLGGQNGYGGSLSCIYSKKFIIDSANGSKSYKQVIENHVAIKRNPEVKSSKENFTAITYIPNYDYFNVSDEVRDNLGLLYESRIKNVAFAYPEISFYYNKQKVSSPNLKTFVKNIHEISEYNEVENGRIAVFYSDTSFSHISTVNGINTYNGGTHVDYATNKIVDHVRNFIQKKHKLEVKPIDIKSKLFLLLSIRMLDPRFEGQVKSELKSPNGFKELVDSLLTKKFLDSILKNDEIMLPIVEAYKLKMQVKDNIDLKKLNQGKKKLRIEKYFPAIKEQKILFLCEGDSAANGLLPVLGREFYSYFALKGVPLNSLEAPISKIKENDEIKNIIAILNLNLVSDKQELSHEFICLAGDQDADGSHIKALLLTLYRRFAPSLIKQNKIKFLQTPLIVGRKKDKIEQFFFNLDDYKTYEIKNPNSGLKYQYMKGLGTWVVDDLKYLINKYGINTFIKDFEYTDNSFEMIDNWMGKKTVEFRKTSLRNKEFKIDGI